MVVPIAVDLARPIPRKAFGSTSLSRCHVSIHLCHTRGWGHVTAVIDFGGVLSSSPYGPHSAPPLPIINIIGWKIKLVRKWKGGLSKVGCGSLTAVQLYFSTCMKVATHALRCSCD